MTTPQKRRIFISYRRTDSAGYAGRIYDRLSTNFGKDTVFMDVDTIEAGVDFVKALENAVQSCDVLVALISKNWLNAKDKAGKRRLDNPEDYVRIEIAAALSRDIRVIPVLVDGVDMPQSAELPENLQPLTRRNALPVDHNSFDADVQRLISNLELALKAAEQIKVEKEHLTREERERGSSPAVPFKKAFVIGGVSLLILILMIFGGTAMYQIIFPDVAPTATNIPEIGFPPTQEATAASTLSPTLTGTSLPTETKTPSKTPVPLLGPIAGTWIGVDKGTVGGNPVPDRDVELLIRADCNLGDECGTRTVHLDDNICGGNLFLVDVQDDIYTFDTDLNEKSASFCGEGGIIVMKLSPDNMLLSNSDGYNSSGLRVIKNGTYSHPQ